MMRQLLWISRFLVVIAVLAGLVAPVPPAAAATPDWVARSDKNANVLIEVLARFNPEAAGQFGVEGLDEEILQLPAERPDQQMKAIEGAMKTLQARLEKETHPSIRQDLEIMIEAAEQGIEGIVLNRAKMMPYFDLPQTAFQGIRALLDDQVDASRHPAALVRLKRYAGMEKGYTPLAEQAVAFVRPYLKDRKLRGPFVGQLEKDLGNSPRFVAGIEQLFQKYEIKGYEKAYGALKEQLAAYEKFVRSDVKARASDDFRLPADIYAYNLRNTGIDMPVGELVSRAKTSFREIQNEMQALAEMVAKERKLPSSDYRDVIRELKKAQLVGDAILPHYQKRMVDLERIIDRQKVITLPERDAEIRLASEAESAAIPAPHLQTPRLIGNTGEVGQFVLPLRIPGEDGKEVGFDDFTFEAASWTLTVHEGRPGHELQWASIVEQGVSLARALFAFNSVNVEGWALYTEAEMKPYMPLEGQLISLQHRLMRAARAFLDPGLQLGHLTREEAFRVLENDVVVSHPMAMQEVERYTFWAPGQATSYFCGYQRLMELRADTERMLGDAFDRRAFHDFVLAQGLIPPSLLRSAVMDDFVSPRMAAGRTGGADRS